MRRCGIGLSLHMEAPCPYRTIAVKSPKEPALTTVFNIEGHRFQALDKRHSPPGVHPSRKSIRRMIFIPSTDAVMGAVMATTTFS